MLACLVITGKRASQARHIYIMITLHYNDIKENRSLIICFNNKVYCILVLLKKDVISEQGKKTTVARQLKTGSRSARERRNRLLSS